MSENREAEMTSKNIIEEMLTEAATDIQSAPLVHTVLNCSEEFTAEASPPVIELTENNPNKPEHKIIDTIECESSSSSSLHENAIDSEILEKENFQPDILKEKKLIQPDIIELDDSTHSEAAVEESIIKPQSSILDSIDQSHIPSKSKTVSLNTFAENEDHQTVQEQKNMTEEEISTQQDQFPEKISEDEGIMEHAVSVIEQDDQKSINPIQLPTDQQIKTNALDAENFKKEDRTEKVEIISMEYITPSNFHNLSSNSKSLEKLDELTSLEREIAEMHHVEPSAPSYAQRVNDVDHDIERELSASERTLVEMQPPSRNSTPLVDNVGGMGSADLLNTPIENEDLIAVLKGVHEDPPEHEAEFLPINEGVTIEGEGQYEFMDVIDDEIEDVSLKPEFDDEKTAKSAIKTSSSAKESGTDIKVAHGSGSKSLTPEQIRAVAMEQIAGLNAVRSRNRKLDSNISPEVSNLLSSLDADWSDEESFSVPQKETPLPSPTKNGMQSVTESKSPTEKRKRSPPIVTNVVIIKEATKKSKIESKTKKNNTSNDGERNVVAKAVVEPSTSVVNLQARQITGFTRKREVKPRIIWDPDAPETQVSYSELLRKKREQQNAASLESVAAKGTPVAQQNKKKALVPKEKKPQPTVLIQSAPLVKKPVRSVSGTPTAGKLKSTQQSPSEESTACNSPTTTKRRSETPISNGSGKKKKVSEIDRLMGDEGAVNMLASLESERKNEVEPNDKNKTQRVLMRSRALSTYERRDAPVTPVVSKKESPNNSVSNPPVAKKRGPKKKASNSWDYVYNTSKQQTEDAMIARRRSTSSYSSSTSVNRLSIDGPIGLVKTETKNSKESSPPVSTLSKHPKAGSTSNEKATASKSTLKSLPLKVDSNKVVPKISPAISTDNEAIDKNFEFVKPNQRKRKSPVEVSTNPFSNDVKKDIAAQRRKNSNVVEAGKEKQKNAKQNLNISNSKEIKIDLTQPTPILSVNPAGGNPVNSNQSDVLLKKIGKVTQVVFNTHKARIQYTFTAQMMNKFSEILMRLSTDDDCHVVIFMTNAQHFCQGIDFYELTVGSAEKRRNAANMIAAATKNYLKTLSTFPKPIIAAVVGHNIGLGVTQLELFDIVVASDRSSYETPYAKIGQLPEANCFWRTSSKLRNNYKTKLLWLSDKLIANEAAMSGLVMKITSINRLYEEAMAMAKKIAANPQETYKVMKEFTLHSEILDTLEEEFNVIASQWASSECCERFKKILETGHF